MDSKKDVRSHSLVESDAPAGENDENKQLQEILELSAGFAQVDLQATAEAESRKSWAGLGSGVVEWKSDAKESDRS